MVTERFFEPHKSRASRLHCLATAAEAALPGPWVSTDIGAVGLAGSAAENGGQFAVRGSRAVIWGSADAFHYVHQRLNGNA